MPRYKVPTLKDLNGWGGIELPFGKRPAGRLIRRKSKDVEKELLLLAGVSITEIVSWSTNAAGDPVLTLKNLDDIPMHARRAIKKVKVTPGKDGAGPTVEVELFDKVRLLQTLATAAGIMEKVEKDPHRLPSVIDMKMVGPDQKKDEENERQPEGAAEPDV